MATINSISGAPLVGNPIMVSVSAAKLDSAKISFHRIVLTVTTDGSDSIKMSSPVYSEETLSIDISSALRSFAESLSEYTPLPCRYDFVSFSLSVYDEYVDGGELKTTAETTFAGTYHALRGAFTDVERLNSSNGSKSVQDFCRKPATPQIVCVGDLFANTPNLKDPVSLASLSVENGPVSQVTEIVTEGLQQIGDVNVYAVPESMATNRYQFRFINGLGVLDSFVCYCLRDTEVNITSEFKVISRVETFADFSRGINRKSNNYEVWKMSSGPLDREWTSWFIHEFLMAEYAWIYINENWVRCHIIADETVGGVKESSAGIYEVSFSVRFDINGPVSSTL